MRLKLTLLSLLCCATALAAPPKLGVLIVIDQLSADVWERRMPLTKAGLKRLATQGFRYREMRYETAPTLTAEGHSTLVTGAYPELHGVVANRWFDSVTGGNRNAGADPRYWVLHRKAQSEDAVAPTAQRVSSLSEALKSRFPDGKVVSIAAKGRSATMMGGGAADIALWFDIDGSAPQFTTSSYYADNVPDWLKPLNDKLPSRLPANAVERMKKPKPGYESDELPVDEWPELQPMMEKLTVDVALAAVDAYALGKDESPDLLFVSFSGHDQVGHAKGPDSPESLADFQAIDQEIGRLLSALDSKVGNYVVAMTADHGGNQSPDVLGKRDISAGRVDVKALTALLEKEADAALGGADYFRGFWAPGLYAHPAQVAKLESILPRLRELARAQPGVFDLLSTRGILNGNETGMLASIYRRGTFSSRSPDFMLVPKPYWHYGTKDVASHGTPWIYDRTVPLVFFGKSVKSGVSAYCQAIDVAPTLAALLSIPPPAASTGAPLREVVSSSNP